MEKHLFDKIEEQLRKYFAKDEIIKYLKGKLDILDEQIKAIAKDIKECNIMLEPTINSPSFEERIQSSSTGESYAERETMRVTELQIRRMTERQFEREKILDQIDALQIENNEIEWKIKDFTEDQKKLLKLLYKNKWYEQQIADTIFITQSQVNRRKKAMLNKLAMLDEWNEVC